MSGNPTGEVEKMLRKDVVTKPANIGDLVLKQILNAETVKSRKERAIKVLNQAIKYINGYLDDYDILVERNYRPDEFVKISVTVYIVPYELSETTETQPTD